MLPSELLLVKVFKNEIRPYYLSKTPQLLNLASSMLEIYRRNIGSKRSEIRSQVRALEYGPYNFRLVRGLSAVLDRFSLFATDSPVDPYIIRRTVFSLSGGCTESSTERRAVILEASKQLGVPPDCVERFLWSDLEGEQILKDFSPISPEELIAQYNLSITQTLLFKSNFVEFSADGNWKHIFRAIKRLGLMYTITKGSDTKYTIAVEGPVSVIKLTERYGTSLAKLLPEILACKNWLIKAQIIRGRRLLNFQLKSSEGITFPETRREPLTYDSSLEESFARRFSSLGSKWALLREPDPIPVGNGVMLPDFAFELGKKRVYMEIVGFWTPEYIKKKTSKLRSIQGIDIIVAVDSSLGVIEGVPGYVVPFTGEVPLRPVLEILEKIERDIIASELRLMEHLPINLKGTCVPLAVLASELGVSKEALLKRISESPPDGYILIDEVLVQKDHLPRLKSIISGEPSLKSITTKLAEEGITNPIPFLRHFGYSIKWHGLDSAEVIKAEPKEK